MSVLIVYAHEEPRSFNGAMKNVVIKTFEGLGRKVVVSDLYRMKFKAVADGEDFLERRDKHRLRRQHEEQAAGELGTLAHDILVEQEKLRGCDLLILQFPLWWFGVPAIMKGWMDRVLSVGFAYGGGKGPGTGGLRGRKAMLSITTGGPEAAYGPGGPHGDLADLLYPLQRGVLPFCGFDVLPPHVAFAPAQASPEQRAKMLEGLRARLTMLDRELPSA